MVYTCITLFIHGKKTEIAEKQCGCVEDKGKSNAIYSTGCIRKLTERALEVQKDLYIFY